MTRVDLRTLSGTGPNCLCFALAVRRINDWTPQVPEAAQKQGPKIAQASNPEHVVEGS